ncbi:PadR family transcriptional regulator [Rhodocytophaga aerolata]|uniref:PadR family transcriptional regulator n=1 Tax=Rhodocytophaga aerolata TaxID=455078 RepID=A0ABT8RFR4_9BACT|nr:PadR family transcriptional regulator [Rhodocytophaga aerolata]MDO1450951.1 PadR family transcriptional regulator [Rhodocytophaga aerolata]
MRRSFLGEFEEVILLVVASCHPEAYGVTVWERVQVQTGRKITMSAVHATLYRLEEKGFLHSNMGGSTQERGGRRKRFFTLTPAGASALQEIQALRTKLWQGIPQNTLQLFGI